MKRILSVAALLLAAAASLPLRAQDQPAVFVQALTPDAVGKRVVYHLREGLRRGAGLRLTEDPGQAAMTLLLVSMESQPGGNGQETAYSAVVVLSDSGAFTGSTYWNHLVGVCGVTRAASCAQSLLATLDQAMADVRAELRRRPPAPKVQPL